MGTGKSDTTGLSDDEEGGTSPLWVRSCGIYIYKHNCTTEFQYSLKEQFGATGAGAIIFMTQLRKMTQLRHICGEGIASRSPSKLK